MEVESCVPPGFRFHPTEEELVGFYLTRKVASLKIDIEVIADVDLYRIEPWDLQDRCKYGDEDQNEWYFFSHKDKKYPTGTRTNRATAAGFWKATGRDKAVVSKSSRIIGMRKTLVFYEGRAPNGRKSDWIVHEYRLQTTEHAPPQEEGWVVCRAFRKPSPSLQRQAPLYNSNWNNPSQQYSTPTLPTCTPIHQQQQLHLTHLFQLPHLQCSDDHHGVPPAALEEQDGRRNGCGGQLVDWNGLLGEQTNQPTATSSSSSSTLLAFTLDDDDQALLQNHGVNIFTSF